MNDLNYKFNSLDNLIGNTPLIEIIFSYKGKEMKIYSKLEYYNYTGSIKDRVALYILKKAYNENKIKANDTIIEATSGNTGISFSAIGSFLNNPVKIYMPNWMSEERKQLLINFGAEIKLISKSSGGFLECIRLCKEDAKINKNIFLPSQFENNDNIMAHYLTTGPEIAKTLSKHNLTPNCFIAGVGTGGTIMGISRYLKTINPKLKSFPLEPSNSKILSCKFSNCSHRIEGISDEFVPPILKLYELNKVIDVGDGDSIVMAKKLSNSLGLGVGISSGANFLGALKVLLKEGLNNTVVTVFSDDNKKYLSTALTKDEPIKESFLSKDIELLSFNVL